MDENREYAEQPAEIPKPPDEFPAEGRADIPVEPPRKRKSRPAKTRGRTARTAAKSAGKAAPKAAAKPTSKSSKSTAAVRPKTTAKKSASSTTPVRPKAGAAKSSAVTDAPGRSRRKIGLPASSTLHVGPRVVAGAVAAVAAAAVGVVGVVRGRRKH